MVPKASAFNVFRQHGQAVFADFGKAALDLDFLRASAFGLVDLQRAVADRRHEGRVAFEDAEFTFGSGDHDHVDVIRTDEAGRGDEFEVQCHFKFLPPSRKGRGRVENQASAASFLAFSTASSIPPTM